ncbi:MAG TPA: BON domain-containing protein [Terriglobia bacterium]
MNGSKWRTGPLVAVLTLTVAGCNFLKKPPAANDQTITSDLQAKLFGDPVLKTHDIRVSTQNGVVTLAGSVDTDLEKAAVERFANQESGVKQVVDQLVVGSALPAVAAAQPEQAASPAEPAPRPAKVPRKKKHAAPEVASLASPGQDSSAAPATAPSAPPGPAPVIDQAPPPAAPAAPPPPVTATIPAGTVVTVRMIDAVDSTTSQPGQEFAATVAAPVVVGSQVVIPPDSTATVRLVTAKSSGRFEGSAQLALELHSLTVNGSPSNVQSSEYVQNGTSRGRRTAETVGGGSVLGGLIGAIAGGGKGAAIGAGVGAASGTGVEAASKRGQVKVPSEAKIDFTLKAPLTVTLSQ